MELIKSIVCKLSNITIQNVYSIFFSYRLRDDGTKEKIIQKMSFPLVFDEDHPDPNPNYCGKPKGAMVICAERFGIPYIFNKNLAQLRQLLSKEEDFTSSVYLIEEEMSRRNVEVIFFPKFHCEGEHP